MRQAMAGTRAVVSGQTASVTGAGVATRESAAPRPGIATPERAAPVGESRGDARQGMLLRAGRWWVRHWLRYAEVVGAQWR
ncbi:MAG TPA: hypothetical protein VK933_16675 [Longimicrobiales bacterium]|nr:hypothetical protein [Longimicrobiales bacterium]